VTKHRQAPPDVTLSAIYIVFFLENPGQTARRGAKYRLTPPCLTNIVTYRLFQFIAAALAKIEPWMAARRRRLCSATYTLFGKLCHLGYIER